MEGNEQYLQLGKLSALTSEESLEQFLTTLWKTRRNGLRSPEKSDFQSLLNLSSVGEVDPVLACLRSLIRKFLREDLTEDDLLRLFPPNLSCNLQNALVQFLQKHKSSWKEELSREPHLLPGTRDSFQVKTNVPPSFTSFPSSENSTYRLACQEDAMAYLNPNNLEVSTTKHDADHSDKSGILPSFKSIMWTIENSNSTAADRVAIVSLKLQDSTMLPLGESEVKFKLDRDVIESTLRSIVRIRERFSSADSSSGPVAKKQKQ